MTIKRASQLFGNIVATRTLARDGSGSTFLQLGGGGQTQMLHRSLWVRAEGMFSRNVDVLSAFVVPQQSFNVGVNGEIARNTVIGFNVNADRLASPATAEASWISRSSLRVTRSFQTGSARMPTSILTSMARHGGTGSIAGTVFTDWNANGQQDPGDVLLENIPIRLQDLGSTTTSRAGDFAFINVPIGVLQVGVDVSTLPVDFDPPTIPQVQLQLGRGETKRVAFGLVPLNFISGKIVLDANQNGIEDAADSPVDGARRRAGRGRPLGAGAERAVQIRGRAKWRPHAHAAGRLTSERRGRRRSCRDPPLADASPTDGRRRFPRHDAGAARAPQVVRADPTANRRTQRHRPHAGRRSRSGGQQLRSEAKPPRSRLA